MADFTVRKEGGFLADYLAYRTTDGKIYSPALNDELASRARTYLVEYDDTNEIIAYFTLKAGMVGIKQSRFPYTHQVDAVPGIELANFAVNTAFLQAHQNLHGVGYMIFNCTDAKDMYYKELAERVRYFKETEKGVESMCRTIEIMRNEAEIQSAIRYGKRRHDTDGQIIEYLVSTYDYLSEEEAKKLVKEFES